MFESFFKAIAAMFSKPKTPISLPVVADTYKNRDKNRIAFLRMIGLCEGTVQIPNSDDGYKVIVGGTLFDDYSDHPNQKVWIKRINDYSTAAGRYQIIHREWSAYVDRLGLKDFSPQWQDIWAIQCLRELNALDDIDAGRIAPAIAKAGKRWASMPGPLNQAIRTVDVATEFYRVSGGVIAV